MLTPMVGPNEVMLKRGLLLVKIDGCGWGELLLLKEQPNDSSAFS